MNTATGATHNVSLQILDMQWDEIMLICADMLSGCQTTKYALQRIIQGCLVVEGGGCRDGGPGRLTCAEAPWLCGTRGQAPPEEIAAFADHPRANEAVPSEECTLELKC
ncbi:uncharacterized protein LOC124668300 isoform X2 [Lolium rigidum]|nr:uncharacterized protein LOC124668300 isoform X2 [Lolium rigidum]